MGSLIRFCLAALFTGSLVQASPIMESRQADNLARDLATLQAFALTVTFDPQGIMLNWSQSGDEICSFAGVACGPSPAGNQAVIGIDFNEYALGPDLSLVGLLDRLLDLQFFHANSCNFTGRFPSLAQLVYLEEIDLSNNQLTGPFPMEAFEAPVTFLDLRFNKLYGPLPPDLFMRQGLDAIFLNNNQFTGPIPETGDVSIMYITLANNQLTGQIPASFANNKGLSEMLLSGNQLSGPVPDALCSLNLEVLDVSNNPGLDVSTLGAHCRNLLSQQKLTVVDPASGP